MNNKRSWIFWKKYARVTKLTFSAYARVEVTIRAGGTVYTQGLQAGLLSLIEIIFLFICWWQFANIHTCLHVNKSQKYIVCISLLAHNKKNDNCFELADLFSLGCSHAIWKVLFTRKPYLDIERTGSPWYPVHYKLFSTPTQCHM